MSNRVRGVTAQPIEANSGNANMSPDSGRVLHYDEGTDTYDFESSVRGYFEENKFYDTFDKVYEQPGEAAAKGAAYGLPFKVYGTPNLGCGCRSASLHAISEPVDGVIETDYMCDSGWHNYMTFRIKDLQKPKQASVAIPKNKLEIDKFGNKLDGQSDVTKDLEEI